MSIAWEKSDPLRTPYVIKDWLRFHPNGIPMCVICQTQMSVRGETSERKTHFLHKGHSGCPTVKTAGATYEYLKKLPKVPGASNAVKQFVHDNLYGVFVRMRQYVEALTWEEMEEACKQARKLGVWDLVDLPTDLVPYVLLTCMDQFPVTKFRKRAVFFFLEPSPTPGKFWMFPQQRKRNLFEVDAATKDLEMHSINFKLATGSVITDILSVL